MPLTKQDTIVIDLLKEYLELIHYSADNCVPIDENSLQLMLDFLATRHLIPPLQEGRIQIEDIVSACLDHAFLFPSANTEISLTPTQLLKSIFPPLKDYLDYVLFNYLSQREQLQTALPDICLKYLVLMSNIETKRLICSSVVAGNANRILYGDAKFMALAINIFSEHCETANIAQGIECFPLLPQKVIDNKNFVKQSIRSRPGIYLQLPLDKQTNPKLAVLAISAHYKKHQLIDWRLVAGVPEETINSAEFEQNLKQELGEFGEGYQSYLQYRQFLRTLRMPMPNSEVTFAQRSKKRLLSSRQKPGSL